MDQQSNDTPLEPDMTNVLSEEVIDDEIEDEIENEFEEEYLSSD